MNWSEFKKKIDAELSNQGLDDIVIGYIDVSQDILNPENTLINVQIGYELNVYN